MVSLANIIQACKEKFSGVIFCAAVYLHHADQEHKQQSFTLERS
jgi:hypothetical protein